MRRLALAIALGVASAAVAQPAAGPAVVESQQARFAVVTVAEGLSFPWSLAVLPGGDLLVTEKTGGLTRIDAAGRALAVSGLPKDIFYSRQSGLHGVALHPRFATNGFVYLAYTTGEEAANRPVVMRYRLAGDRLTDGKLIWRPEAFRKGPSHAGGRLAFGPDGSLYVSVGHTLDLYDTTNESQDLKGPFGKVMRLNPDGGPATMWSYGHRNVEGLTFTADGRMWGVEHGPKGGDELNQIRKGANYGWPLTTYGIDYGGDRVSLDRKLPNVAQPTWTWIPSIGPSGLAVYRGDAFPEWRGDLLVGALAGRQLQRLEMDAGHVIGVEVLLDGLKQRIRDVTVGPKGEVYILTDDRDGKLLRLDPRPGPTPKLVQRNAYKPGPIEPPKAFASCGVCHSVKAGEAGEGPSLWGVGGRKAGTGAFAYSAALKGSGITWTRNDLIGFLQGAEKMVPGTSMKVPGVPTREEAAALTEYLLSLK